MYNNFGYDPSTGKVTGKIAESLGLDSGTILKPNFIKEAWDNGNNINPKTGKKFSSLDEMKAYYYTQLGISPEGDIIK